MTEDWLDTLKEIVRKRPLVVFQFDGEEWSRLSESHLGAEEFTIARSHDLLKNINTPTACLVFGKNDHESSAYLGLVSRRSPVTTLESRVKVMRALSIQPSARAELLKLVTDKPHAANLRSRLASTATVVVLSSKLSVHLIGKLAAIEVNRGPMHAANASLTVPRHYCGPGALQEDALQTALRAFGLSVSAQANSLVLVKERDTALARINIMEDSVIEHDARSVPKYELVGSDVTGRAVFESGPERLEIFTANRRPLEQVFGVDLIYVNTTRQNIVMVQYKMLEPHTQKSGEVDWIYRPDAQLASQINRMRVFSKNHPLGKYEYRLNPQVFYLKFVKRDGALKNSAIVIPIDHYEQLKEDPACRGPQGGVRVSFETLAGRYLRQGTFLHLIRGGYIGAPAQTTGYPQKLVQAVVKGNRAVVAAIQSNVDEKATAFQGISDGVTEEDP